jgi:hypothetical protein
VNVIVMFLKKPSENPNHQSRRKFSRIQELNKLFFGSEKRTILKYELFKFCNPANISRSVRILLFSLVNIPTISVMKRPANDDESLNRKKKKEKRTVRPLPQGQTPSHLKETMFNPFVDSSVLTLECYA